MSFDPSVVSDLRIDPVPSEPSIHVSWASDEPDGTVFHVYQDGELVYSGTSRWVDLPWPSGPVQIDVGAVDPSDAQTDLGSSLPKPPERLNRARLSWIGGRYLDPSGRGDVAGFRVYGEPSPGAGLNLNRPVATVPLSSGVEVGGFGRGLFGRGGFGSSAIRYFWTSSILDPGTWRFAVRTFDDAGHESTVVDETVTIIGPPGPPAPFPDGLRLHYEYEQATGVVTLLWNPPA